VYDDRAAFKGVIGLPLNLDILRDKLVVERRLPPQSIILVIDAKGNIIIDTAHREHIGQNLAHMPMIAAARNTTDSFLQMPANDGIERLLFVTRPHNTDWRVVVGAPSLAFSRSASLVNNPYLVAIIISAIFGLVFSFLVARQLSNNVSAIVGALKAVGDGRLDQRLKLQGNDELADIAGYFNEMAEKHLRYEQEIREINSHLEQQVEKRTEQLVAANAELDAFSYSVSHDLRAPLRIIDAYSTLLLNDHGGKLEPEGHHLLDRIHISCGRMNSLIDDLLAFSRISRLELNKRTVDLSELASSVAEELLQTHPDRQVEFRITPGLIAEVDPVLMRTVMENLFGNSWKFTRHVEKPLIVFGSAVIDDRLTYFVKDNGAGFNNEYADMLFKVFQRLHSAEEFEGTGVGLVSVKKIINRHGGEIRAEGKEGEGATFYFTL
jgi:signal transduction histidine kinase